MMNLFFVHLMECIPDESLLHFSVIRRGFPDLVEAFRSVPTSYVCFYAGPWNVQTELLHLWRILRFGDLKWLPRLTIHFPPVPRVTKFRTRKSLIIFLLAADGMMALGRQLFLGWLPGEFDIIDHGPTPECWNCGPWLFSEMAMEFSLPSGEYAYVRLQAYVSMGRPEKRREFEFWTKVYTWSEVRRPRGLELQVEVRCPASADFTLSARKSRRWNLGCVVRWHSKIGRILQMHDNLPLLFGITRCWVHS